MCILECQDDTRHPKPQPKGQQCLRGQHVTVYSTVFTSAKKTALSSFFCQVIRLVHLTKLSEKFTMNDKQEHLVYLVFQTCPSAYLSDLDLKVNDLLNSTQSFGGKINIFPYLTISTDVLNYSWSLWYRDNRILKCPQQFSQC